MLKPGSLKIKQCNYWFHKKSRFEHTHIFMDASATGRLEWCTAVCSLVLIAISLFLFIIFVNAVLSQRHGLWCAAYGETNKTIKDNRRRRRAPRRQRSTVTIKSVFRRRTSAPPWAHSLWKAINDDAVIRRWQLQCTSVGNYVTSRVSCVKSYACTCFLNSKSVQT